MSWNSRRLLDQALTRLGLFSILLMGLALAFLLAPIATRGARAFVFSGTIEHRKVMRQFFKRGNPEKLQAEIAATEAARRPVYALLEAFETELRQQEPARRRELRKAYGALQVELRKLLGPLPGDKLPMLPRNQFGATRRAQAEAALWRVMHRESWEPDPAAPSGPLKQTWRPRREEFAGTALAPLFEQLPAQWEAMLRPRWTFYGRFLTDASVDAHFFGGIGPEVLGTLLLTLGAILAAVPLGLLAAIYLCEYARPGRFITLLRTCINTLAGVPSIVFGLFGLAFFLNTLHVSHGKSVLAGSLTLALMILPTIIRASEEALLAVPGAYKEAALGLGAGRWQAVWSVVLPAALPGVLTGVVISLARAAGETAPIIFTAAVSMGQAPSVWGAFQQPTPALPWNIYNLCTEHEAINEIRHVQYGMVLALIVLVLLLNLAAIVLRARITRKLKGAA